MSEEKQENPSTNPPSPETPENTVSQAEIVALLRKTIQQLDRVVERLDGSAIERLPAKTTIDSLVASTQALATSLSLEKEEPAVKETKTPPTIATGTPPIAEKKKTIAKKIEVTTTETIAIEEAEPETSTFAWLDPVLKAVRAILPDALQEKLSDLALTGILTGIIVVLLSSSVLLLPKTASEMAETLPETSSETPEVVETPPQLTSPGKPKPVEIEPPPEPELTPEQSLIASIQDQVAALTSQYPDGVILSIEASFLDSRLMVMLGDEWYQLNSRKQQKLANAILERSRRLDFRKLELLGADGTLLARNPVVGNDMVILHSTI